MNDGLPQELTDLLNRHSVEKRSSTPDFILAQFMLQCLRAYEQAVVDNRVWNAALNETRLKTN